MSAAGIKVFQHRVNDIRTEPLVPCGEIDVQINSNGAILAQHDPDEMYPTCLGVLTPRYESFLVDIKQNMELKYFDRIAAYFGPKLFGFIDVPYPCSVQVSERHKVFHRVSEFERAAGIDIYVDPLKNWDYYTYRELLWDNFATEGCNEIILAAPDLHGVDKATSIQTIADILSNFAPQAITGIITKHPLEVEALCYVS